MTPQLIIGLAGRMASGKGVVASLLCKQYSAYCIRSSEPLRQTLEQYQILQSRAHLSLLSEFLRATYGEDRISRAVERAILQCNRSVALFDGMRRLIDAEVFKQYKQFHLIFIETSIEIRYKRYVERNENPGDGDMTFDDFCKRDSAESEQEIDLLKQHADAVIQNDGSRDELIAQVEHILSSTGVNNQS